MTWHGMSLPAWLRLITKNRFRVAPRFWHIFVLQAFYTSFHSLFRGYQWIGFKFWQSIDPTWPPPKSLESPPLFILGHWRSGTTLLHELMVLDQRHTFPTSYECFEPNHFVLSEGIATRLLGFLTPSQRPMDNMKAGWDRPQEDEFALCNLGLPSPYLTMAFPNEPPQDQDYWTLDEVPPAARERWKRVFLRFLCEISSRRPRRIVLKSPPHTCRVKLLLEMFPNARFIHITRHPCSIFPSTVHLWRRLYAVQGLQKPNYEGLEEYVFDNLARMYEAFESDRELIPPDHFCELRYEDLVADTVGVMHDVYRKLDLGGFSDVRPAIEDYLEQNKGYETNKFPELSPELLKQIATRWRSYAERYGYQVDATTPSSVGP
ncbi:MAG TPA: sulfotransferase [Pirellulales bacterium]